MDDPGRQRRWSETRAVILQATVEVLVEAGYAATTIQRVQDRAGVSRGSLTNHFASKQDLLVAAVRHVADGQLLELAKVVPPGETTDLTTLVASLHDLMSGPVFVAGLELWMAARTDEHLRSVLLPSERVVGEQLRRTLGSSSLAVENERSAGMDLDLLLVLLRGIALTGVLRQDDQRHRALLAHWVRGLES